MSGAERALISGLVITYNRADLIGTCLRALAFVDELVVVDKSSTDGTTEIARALADRVIVVPWSPVVEQTRELAIRACSHDWILCLDDDECLSVEAAKFIQSELVHPRANVYLLPQRHYILGEHDERAYYWPEYQPRFFRRDAIVFFKTVHDGTAYNRSNTYTVPFEGGVCIHHLSHKDVEQWISKANRYTSLLDRKRVAHSGNDLVAFAHSTIDRYIAASRGNQPGSYVQAVAVLRSTYDIIDRLKTWEEENGRNGAHAFREICSALDAQYKVAFGSSYGNALQKLEYQWLVENAAAVNTSSTDDIFANAVEALRESVRDIREAHQQELATFAIKEAALKGAEVELANAKMSMCDLREELAEQEREVFQVREQLGRVLAEVEKKNRQLEILEILKAEVGDARSSLQSVSDQLRATHASASWRVTAPLRAFYSRHPNLKHRLRAAANKNPRLKRFVLRALRYAWRLLQSSAATANTQEIVARQTLESVSQSYHFEKFRLVLTEVVSSVDVEAGDKVLFVSHVMPFPPRAGNEYRIHRLLAWMKSQGQDVTLVVCPLPGEMPTEQQIKEASKLYPRLLVVERSGTVHANFPEAQSWLKSLVNRTPQKFEEILKQRRTEALSPSTLEICRAFCPDTLIEVLLALDSEFRPATVVAEYVFMTRFLALLRDEVLTIVDTHDVFSTKSRKVNQYGINDGLALTEKDEAILLERANVAIGIQPEETAKLRRLVPRRRVINAGVDFLVDEHAGPPPARKQILLVASNNPMNNKGLRDFLRFAWPLIRRQHPDAELIVVGDVGRSIEVIPSGVIVLGRVDDLRTVYAEADVVINPTVAGTGLKIKTVEAVCHLRTTVVFRTGADGIGEVGKRFLRLATNWYEFACAVDQALIEVGSLKGYSAHDIQALVKEFSAANVYAEVVEVMNGK